MKYLLFILMFISNFSHANYTVQMDFHYDFFGHHSESAQGFCDWTSHGTATVDSRGGFTCSTESGQPYRTPSYGCNQTNLVNADLNALTCTFGGNITCTSPQVPSSDGSTCVSPSKDCTSLSQTVYSENASIDLGTQELTTASQTKNCVSGCEVMPIDYRISNAAYDAKFWSKLIQGTTHYLISGVVSYSGKSCTASQTSPTDATVTDTCASGDIYIKVAGKSACVTAPSTVKSVAPTITQSPIGTNPKTIQTTTNPVDPSAPSQTTVSTITYDSSGAITNVTSNSINTVNNTYGQNPTDSQTTDMSGVESKLDSINKSLKTTGTVDGKSNGSNTANNSFYTSKYPNGLTDVMSTASSNLSNSSIGKLTNDLTPNLGDGGTAPSWTWNFNLGKYMNFGSYTLTTDSDLWAILSVIFIITSLFVARRLVFGG